MTSQGDLHVVVFQEMPGLWVCRGLEHDILAEASTIGDALRGIVKVVRAHTLFDYRHNRAPLSAFAAAPRSCWQAFAAGTLVPMGQLGIDAPEPWRIIASIAPQRPLVMAVRRPPVPRAIAS